MRVDTELLRAMLEAVERAPEVSPARLPPIAGYGAAEQRRHLQLLVHGGYLAAYRPRPRQPAALTLTVEGQRLLDGYRTSRGVGHAIGDVAWRVVVGVAIGLVVAKARVLGISAGG